MRGSAAVRTSVVPGGALAGPWVRNELWRRARAVPSLDLRFADDKSLRDAASGQSLITFTRASSGTFVDSAGVIQTATTDVPRFDHNPTTGESLGLLVEEARTNLLLRSEEFDNASWSKTGSSVTANTTTAPDDTSTTDKLVEDTSTGGHLLSQSVAGLADSTTFTASIFCKAVERNWVALTLVDKAGTLNRVWFNVSTGTQGATNGTVSAFSAILFANGWYRLSVSASTATGGGTPQVRLSMGSADNTASYAGNGTSGVFVWGAQLEAGAFPTSYIPTTSATVTRSADVASITGTAFSSWYRQDEGTAFVNAINPATSTTLYAASDGTTNNRIQADAGTNTRIARVVTGGTTQASNSIAYTFGAQQQFALSYVLNSINFANAGTLGTEDTSATIPTVDQLRIGANPTGANALNSTIRRLTYWPTRLTNNVLQEVTR